MVRPGLVRRGLPMASEVDHRGSPVLEKDASSFHASVLELPYTSPAPEVARTHVPTQPPRSHRPAARSEGTYAPDAEGLLPLPPDDHEKYLYARPRLWVLTTTSVIAAAFLCFSQYKMVLSNPVFWIFIPYLVLAFADFLISLRVNGLRTRFNLRRHKRMVRSWRPPVYPSVDVLLPVCGEPLQVLHNTWTHVDRLRRTYRGGVTVYVLDDVADAQVRAMAEDFGFVYGSRKRRGWFKKAGNLNYGLSISGGEYVLILDADFAPRPDLLYELLPYMDVNPRVGIVQSPQFFRVLDSQNWIERGAGAIQELFYRAIQASRSDKDAAVCVGTCAIYRRAALRENGGVTLADHSEDVYTGFDLAKLGWTLSYVPIALSTGVCPDSIGAFQNQQYRWCNGSLTMMTSRVFWRTEMGFTVRLCYIAGFLHYIRTAMATFVYPAIPLALLIFEPSMLNIRYVIWIVPALVYEYGIFPVWHRAPYGLEAWSARLMYGWAHVFVIWDMARGRQMGWRPTRSSGARQYKTRRFWIGLIGWSGGAAVTWVGLAVWRMMTTYPQDAVVILALGLFYAATVLRIMIEPRPHEAAA